MMKALQKLIQFHDFCTSYAVEISAPEQMNRKGRGESAEDAEGGVGIYLCVRLCGLCASAVKKNSTA